jgi:cation:H+ antiporter
VAGVGIFLISKVLVLEGLYLATAFAVPTSFIGLLVLSIGTNAPELMIAVRAVRARRKDIAFGNYVGSAAMNTLLFGFLLLFNGGFVLERREFLITAPLFLFGLGLFALFSRSRSTLSRSEGIILLFFYFVFLIAQLAILSP